ncbi:hypothetical protein Leryth_012806 [Lithospermum erythrorhizon]|nr:hypothetical protein Leryth_012806 [Lithospermum erythrorhizon]
MLEVLFAVAFSAVPLILYIPPIRRTNMFVESVEFLLRSTAVFTTSAVPRLRFVLSRFLSTLNHHHQPPTSSR